MLSLAPLIGAMAGAGSLESPPVDNNGERVVERSEDGSSSSSNSSNIDNASINKVNELRDKGGMYGESEESEGMSSTSNETHSDHSTGTADNTESHNNSKSGTKNHSISSVKVITKFIGKKRKNDSESENNEKINNKKEVSVWLDSKGISIVYKASSSFYE